MEDRIVRALDLAAMAEWDQARQAVAGLDHPVVARLTALIDELQRRHAQRRRSQSALRHELGNTLTIAQANVEGILDGVVPSTPQRLANIRDALAKGAALLTDLRRVARSSEGTAPDSQSDGFAERLSAKMTELRAVAETKNIELTCDEFVLVGLVDSVARDDRDAVERALVAGLLAVIRYTPAGGTVRVARCDERGELLLELRKSVVTKVLAAIGSGARLVEQTGEGATVSVNLPLRKESKR